MSSEETFIRHIFYYFILLTFSASFLRLLAILSSSFVCAIILSISFLFVFPALHKGHCLTFLLNQTLWILQNLQRFFVSGRIVDIFLKDCGHILLDDLLFFLLTEDNDFPILLLLLNCFNCFHSLNIIVIIVVFFSFPLKIIFKLSKLSLTFQLVK